MTHQPNRLAEGGRIDRKRPLSFRFNGKGYQGYAGDTLASALLANGVCVVGRSFKYHRPRGVLSAGAEEPNAFVQLASGPRSEPNPRATQIELFEGLEAASVNAWPSVDRDVMGVLDRAAALLPAGFYYKTFKWPRRLWHTYEFVIRHAAGLGKAPREPDPDRYEKCHVHCDVLVVGAGPAGLAAAIAAGRAGARVILADEGAELGGALLAGTDLIGGAPAADWVAACAAELDSLPEVRVLRRTTAFGYYDHNYLVLLERVADHLAPGDRPANGPRQRLWKVRAKEVVLASGAIERPLVFADNDRPGIMLAGAVRTYLNRYGVKPGARAVVVTNNDSAYACANDLVQAGVTVAAVVDARETPDGPHVTALRSHGIEIIGGHTVTRAEGAKRVRRVTVRPLGGGGPGRSISCDLVCMSGGWSPTVHLYSQSGGRLRFDEASACFVPSEARQQVRAAGAANGAFGLGACVREGASAGTAAAETTGFKAVAGDIPEVGGEEPQPILPLWRAPGDGGSVRAKCFVDFHTDVTTADIALAAREGYESVEHFKRYTTTGMGPDQGKTGNVNALALLAEARGVSMSDVDVTTFRPPYTPVTYGALAGRDIGALADPIRRTPMHAWHERAGAVFEDVGQWKRAFYYPKRGEDKHAAVQREAKAARETIGLLDASTLGKIDIRGKGARDLLNLVYTNAWNKLEVGRCRYGLMLGEDGMVFDDGVTARLAEDHYLMTTTTGNAAHVFGWMEEWLQCEWIGLPVYLTSVTTQWATVAVTGPGARRLLEELSEDVDLSRDAFPHLSLREGVVAGIAARIFRISYTGELSYEVNVPANAGLALWQALVTAGEKHGATPIGTEALHILRAEKGYIAVGQDTDGSVTPDDLGLGWAVSRKKDFLGRRSLSRSAIARKGRKQLVGLLTDDAHLVLPEGAHIVAEVRPKPPMPMLGHVTSSYFSPNLGRSIAMALIENGRARMGEKVSLWVDGAAVRAEVTSPVFFDPDGGRLHA